MVASEKTISPRQSCQRTELHTAYQSQDQVFKINTVKERDKAPLRNNTGAPSRRMMNLSALKGPKVLIINHKKGIVPVKQMS